MAALTITDDERPKLQTRHHARFLPADDVQRADIVLWLADEIAQTQIARVSCCTGNSKRYARDIPVRINAVRALHGARQLRPATNLLFANTSYLTEDLQRFKASTYDLTVKDYGGVLEWINAYRPSPAVD